MTDPTREVAKWLLIDVVQLGFPVTDSTQEVTKWLLIDVVQLGFPVADSTRNHHVLLSPPLLSSTEIARIPRYPPYPPVSPVSPKAPKTERDGRGENRGPALGLVSNLANFEVLVKSAFRFSKSHFTLL